MMLEPNTWTRYDMGSQQSAPRDAETSGVLIEGRLVPPMDIDDTSPVNPTNVSHDCRL